MSDNAGDKTVDTDCGGETLEFTTHVGKATTRSGSTYEIDFDRRQMRLLNPRKHHERPGGWSKGLDGKWHEFTYAWYDRGGIGFDWDGEGRGVLTSVIVSMENMTKDDLD